MKIPEEDLRIDFFTNDLYHSIRIIHIPTQEVSIKDSHKSELSMKELKDTALHDLNARHAVNVSYTFKHIPESSLQEMEAIVSEAQDELGEICAEGPCGRFHITVPADPERDSDLIISNAFKVAEILLSEIRKCRENE